MDSVKDLTADDQHAEQQPAKQHDDQLKQPEQLEQCDEQSPQPEQSAATPKKLLVQEEVGDIFDAPKNSVLVHACNSLGDWSAGIASAFQDRYPNAYKAHVRHCMGFEGGVAPTGTAQLIPPQEGDNGHHYIGCLFTSTKFGNSRDPPGTILENTGPAMTDLLKQIADAQEQNPVAEIRLCRINSGLFQVPWPSTAAVLSGVKVTDDMPDNVVVLQRSV